MATVDLDHKHPDYIATTESRTRSRDLYEGWRAVKAATETYLFKESKETDDDYAIRLKRAVVDNWVERIVQARQSVTFRKSVKREIAGKLKPMLEDVDRNGTSAEAFFQQVAREAQIDGIHWVAVDMPVRPADGYPSAAAESAARHRPFFESIPSDAVIDWEVGPDKKLIWIVIKMSTPTPRLAAGTSYEVKPKWKVWYRDHWEVLVAGEKGATIEAEGPNTSGVVPLVPFFGVKRTDYSGWPVVDLLLEHIILIYNKRSDLDRAERVAAHPFLSILSPVKPDFLNMTNAFWLNTADAAGITVDVKILETTGVAFDSVRASIDDLAHTIRAHALAQAKKDSAQVESADAQREYRENFNSSLRSASVLYEASERQCWEIAGLWAKDTSEKKVDYNRDFDDSTIDQAMVKTLSELAGGRPVITRKTLLETLQKGELIDPQLNIEKELADLDSEDASAAQALAKSLVPVAATLPPEPLT
jgi:hypothetical protein